MQVKCSLFNHWHLCFTWLPCYGRRVRRNVVRCISYIMIEIKLDEFEKSGLISINSYYLDITIKSGKFCGWTKCVFLERDWNNFLSHLEDFINFKKDKVEAFTGWGNEKYFSITFSLKNNNGHFFVSGEIGYPVLNTSKDNVSISHKLFYTIETDLISTEIFLNELKNIKNSSKAVLYLSLIHISEPTRPY